MRKLIATFQADYPITLTLRETGEYFVEYGYSVTSHTSFAAAYRQFEAACRHSAVCHGLMTDLATFSE